MPPHIKFPSSSAADTDVDQADAHAEDVPLAQGDALERLEYAAEPEREEESESESEEEADEQDDEGVEEVGLGAAKEAGEKRLREEEERAAASHSRLRAPKKRRVSASPPPSLPADSAFPSKLPSSIFLSAAAALSAPTSPSPTSPTSTRPPGAPSTREKKRRRRQKAAYERAGRERLVGEGKAVRLLSEEDGGGEGREEKKVRRFLGKALGMRQAQGQEGKVKGKEALRRPAHLAVSQRARGPAVNFARSAQQ